MSEKYTGILGTPIDPREFLLISPEGQNNTAKLVDLFLERLVLLLKHYGLDQEAPDTKWLVLSLRLAREHVPGFRVEEKREPGRKREWDVLLELQLRADVAALAPTLGLNGAFAHMGREERYQQRYKNPSTQKLRSGGTLKRRYLEIIKHPCPIKEQYLPAFALSGKETVQKQ